MLTQATRSTYQTLLDAAVWHDESDKPALIYVATDAEPITVSREHFRKMAGRYAAALQSKGIQARDLVIIAHTQNLESIYAFWGALWIGAIPSMFPTLTEKLDPDIYLRNMAELVRFSDVHAVLTSDDFAPTLRAALDCVVMASSEMGVTQESAAPNTPDPDTIAFLQHSSGTTGLQKGVALSHTAVLNQLAAYSDTLHINTEDVIVSWLPLYHDMGLIAGFLLPLVQGIPLVLMSPFDWVRHPALLLKVIDAHRGTLCWLPNFAYNHMTRRIRQRDSTGLSLASMRAFINCSEPVKLASHQQFLERFAELGVTENMMTVSYAMAENTFAVTQTRLNMAPNVDRIKRTLLEELRQAQPTTAQDSDALAIVSCGMPIPDTQVCVIDDAGQSLAERHIGEIAVKSQCMLTAYYRRPDLQPFVDGWYRTGDMGYLADGEVYIIGRRKDLIINAGKNVYPQDIETIVNTIEGVHPGRAVVFGVPDEREGTELIAVVAEVKTDDAATRKQIGKAIRQQIARQTTVTVTYVELVNSGWLIKTSSGKIARAANRDKWLNGRQT